MKLRAITIELGGLEANLIMRGDRPIATVIEKKDADKLCEMFNDLLDDLNYSVRSNVKQCCKWD